MALGLERDAAGRGFGGHRRCEVAQTGRAPGLDARRERHGGPVAGELLVVSFPELVLRHAGDEHRAEALVEEERERAAARMTAAGGLVLPVVLGDGGPPLSERGEPGADLGKAAEAIGLVARESDARSGRLGAGASVEHGRERLGVREGVVDARRHAVTVVVRASVQKAGVRAGRELLEVPLRRLREA